MVILDAGHAEQTNNTVNILINLSNGYGNAQALLLGKFIIYVEVALSWVSQCLFFYSLHLCPTALSIGNTELLTLFFLSSVLSSEQSCEVG